MPRGRRDSQIFPLRKTVAAGEIRDGRGESSIRNGRPGMAGTEFYARLREERLRLELSRERAAEIAGVSPRTVRRWETEIPMPVDALIALAGQGYDAQYVCTGQR